MDMTRGKGWRPDRRPLAVIGRGNKLAPRAPIGFLGRVPPEPAGPEEVRFGTPHEPPAAPEPEEATVWSPGDGDALLDGGEAGTITLLWVGLEELRVALHLADPQPPRLVFDRAGARLSVLDAAGRPVRATGELRLGNETLRFTQVAVIRAWG
jgi:hypothetical protein